MPRRLVVAALLAALVAPSLPACRMDRTEQAVAVQVTIGDVVWYVDYEAAVSIAEAEDKPLWVHFGENPG